MENKKGTETQKMTREDFAVLWKTIHLKIIDTYDVPPEILWVNGSTIGTLGNFSASTGKAKSKKTFNVSAIVAAALKNDEVLQYSAFLPENKRKILYVDTEQSKYHCHKVMERIMCLAIRQAQQSDAVELKELFQNTVIVINRRDYSQVEVEDWASCGDDLSNIEEMIKTHYFIVAVNQQSQIVGFSSITPHGYLHSMFVHKDFQGKGIATMLLEEIERYAITTGIMRITSEVSLTARPFFEKKGYVVEEEQKRKANQLSLTNFWMAREVTKIQRYEGRIPACGVFCGGCPTYTREKNPCKGAELNSSRCEKCKTFHLCCLEKEITHCFQCSSFPCARFKGFTKRWLKYGQNFIENQKLLSEIGEVAFLEYYNKKVTD